MMGLDEVSVQKLILLIVTARGYWRMPNNATCPPFRLARGVPQRLSASVLLASVALCCLVARRFADSSVLVAS